MIDLVLGMAVILLLAALVAVASTRFAKSLSPGTTVLSMLTLIAATMGFAAFLHGHLPLVRLLPFSNVIVLGNWIPIGVGGLVGVILGKHEWGWTPGLGHAVVVFGRTGDDLIEVGDPSVGREHWRVEDLRVLWPGAGLRLVRR